MNKLGPIITVAVAVVLIVIIAWQTGGSTRSPATQPGGTATEAAPAVGGMTLAGQRWNLQDQRGKVVLLDFWATWCPSCVASMPAVKKIHEHFKGNHDFILVGIDEDYSQPPLKAYVKENEIGWLQIYDPATNSEMARKFGVSAIPVTFLVDRQGNFRRADLGLDELIAEIEKLLKTPG